MNTNQTPTVLPSRDELAEAIHDVIWLGKLRDAGPSLRGVREIDRIERGVS